MPAALLLAACSGSLNQPPSGETGGTGGPTGGGGTGQDLGEAGTTGSAGNEGTAGASGTTGVGGTATASATGGTTAGAGGSAPLPACTVFGPMFSVCFVNDVDVPTPEHSPFLYKTSTSGSATIEAVGSGTAPGKCRTAHIFGMDADSHWWLQARAADNLLWTIGVRGLSSTPPVRQGDAVTLKIDWDGPGANLGFRGPHALLQLSDAAGTPLLWAGANAPASTWISFAPGAAACTGSRACSTPLEQRNIIATVNGSSTVVPPYGAATLGDYLLQVTDMEPWCPGGDYEPNFQAAAVRIPPQSSP